MRKDDPLIDREPYALNNYLTLFLQAYPPKNPTRWFRRAGLGLFFILIPFLSSAQPDTPVAPSPSQLKKLSIEQLLDLEVTLVSRTPQKLSEVASAIQVITGADIRRSGATNIPEALLLLPNLQVAQLNASSWIIGARGFNTVFANKLLVMIDGRTVYTPFFGGVLWELQNLLLEDVDRIEVVSGPGGTLWGANAVNGVINIITKSSADTQGVYGSVAAGTFLRNQVELRYGGRLNEKLTYRVFGQHFNRNPTKLPTGFDNQDAWNLTQGGFRLDWAASAADQLSVQGNLYGGTRNTAGGNSGLTGHHLLGRWSRSLSKRSGLELQLFYDRYYRNDVPAQLFDQLTTYDVDFQHRFPIQTRHSILWGLGYRLARDFTESSGPAGILPPRRDLPLYTGFVQDEMTLSDQFKLTLGTKILHNVFTGFELQPSVRLAWSVKPNNLLWGAVSRAVRTPSRFDVDYFLPTTLQPPNVPSVAGGPNFRSEKVIAYELGYRWQPSTNVTFSLASFYNIYQDVYSVEALPGTVTYQIQNGSEATSWGAEFSGQYQVTPTWRIRGGYTYFNKDLRSKPGRNHDPSYLGNDVKNRVLLQSILDLPGNFQFDLVGRYLDYLPKTISTARVPSYITFDASLAWLYRWLEIAVVGQSLGQKQHVEFQTLGIPRSLYGKVSVRF